MIIHGKHMSNESYNNEEDERKQHLLYEALTKITTAQLIIAS